MHFTGAMSRACHTLVFVLACPEKSHSFNYLRHQRLHGVRRALLQTAPAPGAVKHAALDWGFIHHGHFARDYRALFGEGPVETLARR